jgi:hypothetical protein
MKLRCHVPVVRSGGLISVALVPAISVLPTASAIRLRPLLGVLDIPFAPLAIRALATLRVALAASLIHVLVAAQIATLGHAVRLIARDGYAAALACAGVDQLAPSRPSLVPLLVLDLSVLKPAALVAAISSAVCLLADDCDTAGFALALVYWLGYRRKIWNRKAKKLRLMSTNYEGVPAGVLGPKLPVILSRSAVSVAHATVIIPYFYRVSREIIPIKDFRL